MTRKLVIVATSPYQVLLFLTPHLKRLPDDVEVHAITNTGDEFAHLLEGYAVGPVHHASITRASVVGLDDLRAVMGMVRTLSRLDPTMTITISPKAGLLGSFAAWVARVPRRLHIFTGQVWDGMKNPVLRTFVITADRVVGRLSTHLAADSPSQADRLQERRVAPKGREVAVPGRAGSICGVDTHRFQPGKVRRERARAELGVPPDAFCFAQVGRVTRDKGISELSEAFARLRSDWLARQDGPEPWLVVAGPREDRFMPGLDQQPGVSVVPFTNEPESVFAASDVAVLASYREGFPMCIIEAASSGVAAIGTDVVGTRDAITPETGWLVPARDSDSLRTAMSDVVRDPAGVAAKGAAARKRAVAQFAQTSVSEDFASYYRRILDAGR